MVADVQLEHGHVRVANRLMEAILSTKFTGSQVRILLALMRLTYGWRQKTVVISLPQLAERVGVAFTGGFRRALDELIVEGVVVEVARSTFAIQKNFMAWGKFSVAPPRLESVWGERPEHRDPEPATSIEEAPTGPVPLGTPPQGSDPTGAEGAPPQGPSLSPHRGVGSGLKSNGDTHLEGRKDRKDRKDNYNNYPGRVRAAIPEEYLPHLEKLLSRVPDPVIWAAEIDAMAESMPGHWSATPEQLGKAIRDFLANGKIATPNLRQFRNYVEGVLTEKRSPAVASSYTEAEKYWQLLCSTGAHMIGAEPREAVVEDLFRSGKIDDRGRFIALLKTLNKSSIDRFIVAGDSRGGVRFLAEALQALTVPTPVQVVA